VLIRLIAGTLSLLAFAAALLAGLWANNDLDTVFWRAWIALVAFLILGALIGAMVQAVVEEHIGSVTRAVEETGPDADKGGGQPTDGAGQA